MITLAVVFIGYLFYYYRFTLRIGDPVGSAFAWTLVVFVIQICFSVYFAITAHEYEYRSERVEIISLDDKTTVDGIFVLGTGGVGSVDSYHYYYDNGDGGFKRGKINALKTAVYQDENDNPNITYNSRRKIFPQWKYKRYFLNPFALDYGEWRYYGDIELHVPENTILREISLDNK